MLMSTNKLTCISNDKCMFITEKKEKKKKRKEAEGGLWPQGRLLLPGLDSRV